MAAEWILCPFGPQPPKGFNGPSVAPFASEYRTGGGTAKGFGLVKVTVWRDRTAALALPNVTVAGADNYATVLTAPQRNALNTRLAASDLGVQLVVGATVLDAIRAIATACGWSAGFDVGAV